MVHLELVKAEALKNNIPIMRDDALAYIANLINHNNYQNILEIGTATGYATLYLINHTNINITTIEKDHDRYLIAQSLLKDYSNVNLILGDALEYPLSGLFDLIIIDAAKTKNQALFDKYSPLLNENGTIITDNIALTCTEGKPLTKNRLNLINKTNQYVEYLTNHPAFNTTFLEIGDRIAISKRK